MLDVADKLGSVVSALVGLLGMALTAHGLRLQRRDRAAAPSELPLPNPDAQNSEAQGPTGLYIPHRSGWVPDSRHPPAQPQGPPPYSQAPAESATADSPPWHRRPVPVLVLGFGLVDVALGLAILTVLL